MTSATFTLREAERERVIVAAALADPEQARESGIVWSLGREVVARCASAPLSALVHAEPLPSEAGDSYDGLLRWARAAYSSPNPHRALTEETARKARALREAFRFHLHSGGQQPQSVTALALAKAERRAINEGWDLTAEVDSEEVGCSEVTLHDADGEPLAGLSGVGGAPSSFVRESGYGRVLFAQLALGCFDRLEQAARSALLAASAALLRLADQLEPSLYHHDAHELLTEASEQAAALARSSYGAPEASS